MAGIGLKYCMFAPIATEPEGALPTYDDIITVGKIITANLTLTFANGKLYGDDALIEEVNEFSSGAIELGVDDMTDEVLGAVYGCDVDTTEANKATVTYNVNDVPPFGGFGYVRKFIKNNVPRFVGYYYPKVRAVLGNESTSTKGESITWQTPTTTLTVFTANTGDWRKQHTEETEEAAKAWVEQMLGKTVSAGG